MSVQRRAFVASIALVLGAMGPGAAMAQDFHVLDLPETTVELPADQWQRLDSPEPYAERFAARARRPGDVFAQVITVVKLPMQITDRVGLPIAPNEYVEFLFVYPVKATLRLRVDRGEFWAESLETFEVPIGTPLPVPWRLNAVAGDDDAVRLLEFYDPEVKRTRFQLTQLFRP